MLLAKLAIPLALATVGTGAAVVAVTTDGSDAATPVSTAAQVWIDAPTGEEPVAVGEVHVGAHATAVESIGSLDLYVDGEKVATDSSLDRNEKLVYGTFDWDAEAGEHQLVVGQGSDRRSAPVTILVTDDPDATTTTSSTTTSTSTTTTVLGSTTTTTGPEGSTTTIPTVTVPGTSPPVTVAPTAPPPTAPPTTAPPAPAPIIDAATLSGTVVYRLNCGYPDVVVSARIRNATSATVRVEGTGFSRGMARNGATFTLSIPSGVWSPADVGIHPVVVEASGPGGTATRQPGTVEIKMNCPKD